MGGGPNGLTHMGPVWVFCGQAYSRLPHRKKPYGGPEGQNHMGHHELTHNPACSQKTHIQAPKDKLLWALQS